MKKFNITLIAIVGFSALCRTSHAQVHVITDNQTEGKSTLTQIADSAFISQSKLLLSPAASYFDAPLPALTNEGRNNLVIGGNSSFGKGVLAGSTNLSVIADPVPERIDDATLSWALDGSGKSYDVEYTYFGHSNKPGKFGLGVDAYSTVTSDRFNGVPSAGGFYAYAAYKYSFGAHHEFGIWANGGYDVGIVGSYYIGNTYVPSSTGSGSFLWELGASYFFVKWCGITAYTSQGNSEWFGIVLR